MRKLYCAVQPVGVKFIPRDELYVLVFSFTCDSARFDQYSQPLSIDLTSKDYIMMRARFNMVQTPETPTGVAPQSAQPAPAMGQGPQLRTGLLGYFHSPPHNSATQSFFVVGVGAVGMERCMASCATLLSGHSREGEVIQRAASNAPGTGECRTCGTGCVYGTG